MQDGFLGGSENSEASEPSEARLSGEGSEASAIQKISVKLPAEPKTVCLKVSIQNQGSLDQILRGAGLRSLQRGKTRVFRFDQLENGAEYTAGSLSTPDMVVIKKLAPHHPLLPPPTATWRRTQTRTRPRTRTRTRTLMTRALKKITSFCAAGKSIGLLWAPWSSAATASTGFTSVQWAVALVKASPKQRPSSDIMFTHVPYATRTRRAGLLQSSERI